MQKYQTYWFEGFDAIEDKEKSFKLTKATLQGQLTVYSKMVSDLWSFKIPKGMGH